MVWLDFNLVNLEGLISDHRNPEVDFLRLDVFNDEFAPFVGHRAHTIPVNLNRGGFEGLSRIAVKNLPLNRYAFLAVIDIFYRVVP